MTESRTGRYVEGDCGDEILPKSYRNDRLTPDPTGSYRNPTPALYFVKNGLSSAGALASPVRGESMVPLQPPGTAVDSPHFND